MLEMQLFDSEWLSVSSKIRITKMIVTMDIDSRVDDVSSFDPIGTVTFNP